MWVKSLLIILLFYISTAIQSSFFAHFNLWGGSINLVFIVFFTIVFFLKKESYYQIIITAIIAGFFQDASSSSCPGLSIIMFSLIGASVKKIQYSLQEKKDNEFPLLYFASLFLISLLVFKVVLKLCWTPALSVGIFNEFFGSLILNLIFALLVFIIYKKFFIKQSDV